MLSTEHRHGQPGLVVNADDESTPSHRSHSPSVAVVSSTASLQLRLTINDDTANPLAVVIVNNLRASQSTLTYDNNTVSFAVSTCTTPSRHRSHYRRVSPSPFDGLSLSVNSSTTTTTLSTLSPLSLDCQQPQRRASPRLKVNAYIRPSDPFHPYSQLRRRFFPP